MDIKDKDYDEKEEGDDRDVERFASRQGSSEESETETMNPYRIIPLITESYP